MSRHIDHSASGRRAHDAALADHRSERYRDKTVGAGRRIRFAREEAGLSIRELAERSGVDKGQISRFENGDALEISAGRFFDLCEALTLDPVYVWTGKTRSHRRDERAEETPAPPVAAYKSEPPPASKKRPSGRPGR